MCGEDIDNDYTLDNYPCATPQAQIFTIIATSCLFFYFAFLAMQSILYTSCNFRKDLPWSCIDQGITFIKVLWKLVISLAFMFDKDSYYHKELGLACAVIGLIVVFRRLHSAIIFNTTIYFMQTFYEIELTWLFLTVSTLELAGSRLKVNLVVVLFIIGVLLSVLALQLTQQHRKKDLLTSLLYDNK